ncbi:hypothetical protein SLEP1_g35902 [Rubroshorea leprosula]|uniref:Glycine-rich protein n=1 Tax=Rubroshorea leprosula TaxID=152421 RepID=A0AAV5KPQ4_9ROSI|nr:hypothetical protein SLEP1_g35902 [Rubroshorea leprosula]
MNRMKPNPKNKAHTAAIDPTSIPFLLFLCFTGPTIGGSATVEFGGGGTGGDWLAFVGGLIIGVSALEFTDGGAAVGVINGGGGPSVDGGDGGGVDRGGADGFDGGDGGEDNGGGGAVVD